jgi:hypothetical protein
MLGNNFKTILKEEKWPKLPNFTKFHINNGFLRKYRQFSKSD